MIDYFTHFIYIQFHLFRRNDAAAVNHRADFADKRTDFLRIHSRLLRNPAERAFIVRPLPLYPPESLFSILPQSR